MRHLMVHVDETAAGTKPFPRQYPGSNALAEIVEAVHQIVRKSLQRGHTGTEQDSRGPERQVSRKEPVRLGVVSDVVDTIKADLGCLKTVLYSAHWEAARVADTNMSYAG